MRARNLIAALVIFGFSMFHVAPGWAQQPDNQIHLAWDQMLGLFAASATAPNDGLAADLGMEAGDILIVQVQAGGVGDTVGLKKGDIITAITDGLWRPGVNGDITYRRGDAEVTVTVTTRFHRTWDDLIEPAEQSAPRKLTVGAGDRQFKTITAAIVAAAKGDEIVVGPGIYREQLLLPSNIALTGSGAGLTRIESSSPMRIAAADAVTISGLSLVPTKSTTPFDTKSAVQIVNAKSVSLTDCSIQLAEDVGIAISGSTDISVNSCAFQGTHKTIGIKSSNSWISVSKSTFNDFGIAIDMNLGGGGISGNGFDGSLTSVRAFKSQTIVRGNAISGLDAKKAWCVVVVGCKSRIADNAIRNCLHGVAMQNAQVTIEDNSLTGNNDGMTMYAGEARIIGNTVYSNQNNGVVITVPDPKKPPEQQSAVISGNTISLNKRNGIRIKDASGVQVSGNIIESNLFGVSSSRSRLDIARNTVIYNKSTGLFMEDTSSAAIERNIVAFNRYGVGANIDADIELANNAVYGNLAFKEHPIHDGNYFRLDRVPTASGDALRVRIFPAYDLQGTGDVAIEPVFAEPGKDYSLVPGSALAEHVEKVGQIGAVQIAFGMKVPASVLTPRAPPLENALPNTCQ